MDPNVCWRDITGILDDKSRGDGELLDLQERASDLEGWIRKGGFLPADLVDENHSKTSALHLLRMIRKAAGC